MYLEFSLPHDVRMITSSVPVKFVLCHSTFNYSDFVNIALLDVRIETFSIPYMDMPKTNALTWAVHHTVEFSKSEILAFVSKSKNTEG